MGLKRAASTPPPGGGSSASESDGGKTVASQATTRTSRTTASSASRPGGRGRAGRRPAARKFPLDQVASGGAPVNPGLLGPDAEHSKACQCWACGEGENETDGKLIRQGRNQWWHLACKYGQDAVKAEASTEEGKKCLAQLKNLDPETYKKSIIACRPHPGTRRGARERALAKQVVQEIKTHKHVDLFDSTISSRMNALVT